MWKIPPFWLTRTWVSFALYPVSLLFWLLISIRKWFWQSIVSRQTPPTTPVIVVGNHWIGGTGKTPIVLELIKYFQRQGLRVGIITRGYTDADTQNLIVCTQDQVPDFIRADEVRLIWQHTASSTTFLGIGSDRWSLYQKLTAAPYHCEIIISDDGLQHYALPRTIELAVFDFRAQGNGFLLPAGGLREPLSWLKNRWVLHRQENPTLSGKYLFKVDRCITHAYPLSQINQPQKSLYSLSEWKTERVTAIAAVGNPTDFFSELLVHGLQVDGIALPDHAIIPMSLLDTIETTIFITEKDATKSRFWIKNATTNPSLFDRIWVVPLSVKLPHEFYTQLDQTLLPYTNHHE
jgi:tetraacyldisaccharide 4'-kinase